MEAVRDYLTLPHAYADYLGGLRWSSAEDAIVYSDDRTFAFTEEIALFLEGFAGVRPLMPIGFVLHFLNLLRGLGPPLVSDLARMRTTFHLSGRSLHNAGTFCAVLCKEIAAAPGSVSVGDVCDRLRNRVAPLRWFQAMYQDPLHRRELPSPKPPEFEQRILQALQAYSDEDLQSWFRHGRGPIKQAAQDIARQVKPPEPRTFAGALEALLDRPRLAGIKPFIAQMVSALTLPLPRLVHQELPVGGYDDVTTVGQPNLILPSQFALDELEFYRRFAEKELLYFRREEPPTQVKQELVVLLDQGVRTWGDVRLVLGAALLALAKQADRRRSAFFLAVTSNGGWLVNPLETDRATLSELVDNSDLTPNPGLPLEQVLEQPREGLRDVVLLTHPRNLREDDVTSAARRVTPGCRLFTVAMEATGSVALSEMKHGVPIEVRRFQVDFAKSAPPSKIERKDVLSTPKQWQGDVEPIGFPFRFGLESMGGKLAFDFDRSEKWLLTAGRNGMLYAWQVDGNEMEILPRAMVNGTVLKVVSDIVCVADGFVVSGATDGRPVAVHYDFVHRICRVAAPDMWNAGVAKHLAAKGRLGMTESSLRRTHAPGGYLHLDQDSGQIQFRPSDSPTITFTPLADGKPFLRGLIALEAQLRGSRLAVKTSHIGTKTRLALHLFRAPEWNPIAEYPISKLEFGFTLSYFGQRLARQIGDIQWEVRDLSVAGEPARRTRKGGFAEQLQILLGRDFMFIETANKRNYVIRWVSRTLEIETIDRPPVLGLIMAAKRRLPDIAKYDATRFVSCSESGLIAVADHYGQIALLDLNENLICMFFAFRNQIAAWMPDGTYYGPASLTGVPPTPNALEKIGKALREASERGRSRT